MCLNRRFQDARNQQEYLAREQASKLRHLVSRNPKKYREAFGYEAVSVGILTSALDLRRHRCCFDEVSNLLDLQQKKPCQGCNLEEGLLLPVCILDRQDLHHHLDNGGCVHAQVVSADDGHLPHRRLLLHLLHVPLRLGGCCNVQPLRGAWRAHVHPAEPDQIGQGGVHYHSCKDYRDGQEKKRN